MNIILNILPSTILINISGLTDFTNIALTVAIIASLLLGREKRMHTWLLIGGIASLLCVLATFLVLDVSAEYKCVPLQFLFIIISLGFFMQFAYHYPFYIPENRRSAKAAIIVAVIALLSGIVTTASWYASRVNLMPARFIFYGIFLVEYFYVIVLLFMRTVQISRFYRAVGAASDHPVKVLTALLRPSGRYAKATRAFAFVAISPLLVAFWTLAYYAELIPFKLFLLIFDYGFLVCLFAFIMIYLNYSVEHTTFMVKLVLSTLVIVLVVTNIMYRITLSVHEEDYMKARNSDVDRVKTVLLKTGAPGPISRDDIPSTVQFVISRPVRETGREITYTPHFIRDATFNLGYANRRGLENLPAVLFVRAGNSDNSIFSLFKFVARGRKFLVGFPLSRYREALHPYTVPVILVIIGSTIAVMLLLPLFFRISLVRPLENLLEGVRLLDDGRMDIDLAVQYNDEIGYLTRAFNRMVRSLSKAEELKVMQQELEMARKIQTSLLPKNPPMLPGLDIAGLSMPSHMVGGDLYFFHQHHQHEQGNQHGCTIAVGDVTGKGMPAALYMAVSMAVLSAKAPAVMELARLMADLNNTLYTFMSQNKMFTALCYVRIDQDPSANDEVNYRAQVSNAGLVPPILRRGNECDFLNLGGLPLGIVYSAPAYRTMELLVQQGDMLFLSSDGIIEAKNGEGELYGFDRFLARASSAPASAQEAVEWIISDVNNFCNGAEQHDDMTILVISAIAGNRDKSASAC